MNKILLAIFIISLSLSALATNNVYKVDMQMDEAARQIRLNNSPVETFKDLKNVILIYWDETPEFQKIVRMVNKLVQKENKKSFAIYKGADTTGIKRAKVSVSAQINKDSYKDMEKFLKTSNIYFDADAIATDNIYFSGKCPSVVVIGENLESRKTMATKAEIENYLQEKSEVKDSLKTDQ